MAAAATIAGPIAPGLVAAAQDAATDPDLLIPGGPTFVRAFLGMAAPIEEAGSFTVAMARFLAQPGMRTRAGHLAKALDELRGFEARSAELVERYGSEAAAFDHEGTARHEKARRLLEWFGIRHRRRDGRVRLELVDGDTYRRRRRLFALMGQDPESRLAGWEAGEPISIEVPYGADSLPFGRRAWNREVFAEPLGPTTAFMRLLEEEAARNVLLAYARMDTATRDAVRAAMGLHDPARNEAFARGLAEIAPYLWSESGQLVLPGGSEAAWRQILGDWRSVADLLGRLVMQEDGKAAHLWRALALVPARRAHYLLTLGASSPEKVRRWADALYASIRAPEIPYRLRWKGDAAELFLALRLEEDGSHLAWPGGSLPWLAAFRDDISIIDAAEVDAEIRRARQEWSGDGPDADARLLRLLLDGHAGDERTSRILKFLGTRATLRYAPQATTPRTVTLLVRNYDRCHTAYGSLTASHNLSATRVEWFIQQLHRAQSLPGRNGIEAALQFQASVLLTQRLVQNRRLTADHEEVALRRLYSLEPDEAAGGYGRGLMAWYREDLVAALGSPERGGSPQPVEIGELLARALTDIGDSVDFVLDGIDYRYRPAATDRARFDAALAQQQMPDLGWVLETDRMLAEYEELGESELRRIGGTIAAVLRARWQELLQRMPVGFDDGRRDGALRLQRKRIDLRAGFERAVDDSRRGMLTRARLAELRQSLVPWFTDALIGVAYAAMIPAPDTIYFRDRPLARLHRVRPEDRRDPTDPWLPTVERRDPQNGVILANSLLGIGEWLGVWRLRIATLEIEVAKAASPALRAWGATVPEVIPRSLESEAQTAVAAAIDTDPSARCRIAELGSPASRPVDGVRIASRLPTAELFRLIQGPSRAEILIAGPCSGGVGRDRIDPATRYLLWWASRAPDGSQRALDAMVGLEAWRGPGQAGLTHPPLAPPGEASDLVIDPWLYGRLLGLRVRLVAALEAAGLPAALQAALYPVAIGAVLARANPDGPSAWSDVETAISEVVTTEAVNDWLIELAFADVFEPRDR